jgi:hypothetical protein
MEMTLIEFAKYLKLSTLLRVIGDEKPPWISRDLQILVVTVDAGIAWDYLAGDRKQKQMHVPAKALVEVLVVENK